MNLIYQIISLFDSILTFLESVYVIISIILLIIVFHFIMYLVIDRKDMKSLEMYSDPPTLSINDLKDTPLVNFIIPAWKEGQLFRKCLQSIKKLGYPRIKVITSVGGNDITLEIGDYYKQYSNFIVLNQVGGSDRPSLGKVRAINQCLKHVSEGIIYFIDADSYLSDQIFLRMIFPLINGNEFVVGGGVRPIKSQENKWLVKYLLIDRYKKRRFQFSRHYKGNMIPGQNFCMKYEVLKSIGRFSEDKPIATDISMGTDIYREGYILFRPIDYRHRIFVDFSATIKQYFKQKIIWVENSLIFFYIFRKIKLIKFFLLWLFSLFVLLTPGLFFICKGLFYIGLVCILAEYLSKIRKYLFFKSTVDKKYYKKFKPMFFLILFFYIYFEAIIIFVIPFHFLKFIIKLKNH